LAGILLIGGPGAQASTAGGAGTGVVVANNVWISVGGRTALGGGRAQTAPGRTMPPGAVPDVGRNCGSCWRCCRCISKPGGIIGTEVALAATVATTGEPGFGHGAGAKVVGGAEDGGELLGGAVDVVGSFADAGCLTTATWGRGNCTGTHHGHNNCCCCSAICCHANCCCQSVGGTEVEDAGVEVVGAGADDGNS